LDILWVLAILGTPSLGGDLVREASGLIPAQVGHGTAVEEGRTLARPPDLPNLRRLQGPDEQLREDPMQLVPIETGTGQFGNLNR